MKLHIFNPEHDMALAANQKVFTAPHAGRHMRADLGFIPALWADVGDMVLVDDINAASESVRHIRKYAKDVVFVTVDDLWTLPDELILNCEISPWGWDCAVKEQLLRADSRFGRVVPDDDVMSIIRDMSSRRFAAERILPLLCDSNVGVVGTSCYCASMEEVVAAIGKFGKSVLKSPWSSSGRGVRYTDEVQFSSRFSGWTRNVLRQQGGIMVEPFYQKIYDFGMEFRATSDGLIEYMGLSVFVTRGGAYTGSICATENDKREMISQYISIELLDRVRSQICGVLQPLMNGVYSGPFGVDMMVVAKNNGDGFLLHPCVELNLRRTMGHVALALTPNEFEARRIMNVYYTDKYRIRIQNTTDNLLNTGLC